MLLMFFFPFDETSRRDFVLLDNFFCFVPLMAVFFDDLLFEFRTISSSLAINRETRVAISAKKSLRVISAMTIFFGVFTFAVDAVLHDLWLQNKKDIFYLCCFYIKLWINVKWKMELDFNFFCFILISGYNRAKFYYFTIARCLLIN